MHREAQRVSVLRLLIESWPRMVASFRPACLSVRLCVLISQVNLRHKSEDNLKANKCIGRQVDVSVAQYSGAIISILYKE
jgi:hypothetical protein